MDSTNFIILSAATLLTKLRCINALCRSNYDKPSLFHSIYGTYFSFQHENTHQQQFLKSNEHPMPGRNEKIHLYSRLEKMIQPHRHKAHLALYSAEKAGITESGCHSEGRPQNCRLSVVLSGDT
ncbi:hypothetical protein M514_20577 [Trichuris suis]|uniref:Uncharacterized protein n=1 Tax=Trichuris suis TaxID=68888 RepID=A0A085NCY2_9BILA|nr:hypothetical protein M514_20577 [Trichuris suis]